MPDYNTQDIIASISTTVEASYNALVETSANHRGIRTRGRGFPVPDQEKSDDRGTIGNQSELPTTQRSGFIIPPTMEITETISTDLTLLYARRLLGGADAVSVVEAAVAHQHLIGMLGNYTAAGRQLPSSSMAYVIGGAEFLYGGCVMDSMRIDATGVTDPTFALGIVASGLYKRVSSIDPALVIPKPTAQDYMLGAKSRLLFNDGTARELTVSPQRLLSFTFNYGNAHDTAKRRVGDPQLDPLNDNLGWYVNRMTHGDRLPTAEMQVALDQNMSEWSAAHNNTVITDFKWRAQGSFIGASVLNRHTFEVWFDKCFFRSTRGVDANGDAALNIGIMPVEPNGTFGDTKIRVVNGIATPVV